MWNVPRLYTKWVFCQHTNSMAHFKYRCEYQIIIVCYSTKGVLPFKNRALIQWNPLWMGLKFSIWLYIWLHIHNFFLINYSVYCGIYLEVSSFAHHIFDRMEFLSQIEKMELSEIHKSGMESRKVHRGYKVRGWRRRHIIICDDSLDDRTPFSSVKC